jgi:hypothetical protein
MNPETVSFPRYGGSMSLMKVEGICDCESDYDSDQAKAEDVPDIVTSYAGAGASRWGPLRRSASLYSGANWSGMKFRFPLRVITAFRQWRAWARGGSMVMVAPWPFLMTL